MHCGGSPPLRPCNGHVARRSKHYSPPPGPSHGQHQEPLRRAVLRAQIKKAQRYLSAERCRLDSIKQSLQQQVTRHVNNTSFDDYSSDSTDDEGQIFSDSNTKNMKAFRSFRRSSKSQPQSVVWRPKKTKSRLKQWSSVLDIRKSRPKSELMSTFTPSLSMLSGGTAMSVTVPVTVPITVFINGNWNASDGPAAALQAGVASAIRRRFSSLDASSADSHKTKYKPTLSHQTSFHQLSCSSSDAPWRRRRLLTNTHDTDNAVQMAENEIDKIWVSKSQPQLNKKAPPTPLLSIDEEDCAERYPHYEPLYSTMLATSFPNGDIGPAVNNNILESHQLINNNNNNKSSVPRQLSPAKLLVNKSDPVKLEKLNNFDQEDIIVDEAGTVVAGSLRALIKRLLPRKDYCPERSFIFAFLLNSRTLVAPSQLLHQLMQHCVFEQNSEADNYKKEARIRFFLNVLRICKEWTETFPYDFRPPTMRERLQELLDLCSSADNSLVQHAKTVNNCLHAKVSKLERYEKALDNIKLEIGEHVIPSEHFSGVLTVSENAVNVAEQLTHIELERLSMIGADEFIYTLAKEYITDETSDTRRTKNVEHYVDWFNRLTFLIATEICKHLKKKHRVKMIEFFILVAKECCNIGNFNSLMAIIAGLNMGPVSRLRKTWAKVETSKLQVLQHQLDPSANFTSYRSTLKAAVWRAEGASKQCEKIIVPFFSLFVKDILVIYQKCSRRLPNGHINFSAWLAFGGQVRDLHRWKGVDCPFGRDSSLLQHLLTSPIFDDKHLQLASFECEPPDTNNDKELHKQLKVELGWPR